MRFVVALAVCIGLGACRKAAPLPIASSTKSLADSADQVIWGSTTIITDRGLQRASIASDTAFMFDDNTRIEMRVVRGIFFSSSGAKDAILLSRQGLYNTRLSILEARGDVELKSIDGRTLNTPFLRYDQRISQISSESSFVVRDADGKETRGIGFKSDPDMQNISVTRHISTKAGKVQLPEQ